MNIPVLAQFKTMLRMFHRVFPYYINAIKAISNKNRTGNGLLLLSPRIFLIEIDETTFENNFAFVFGKRADG